MRENEVATEIPVRWVEPVNLAHIDTEVNVLKEELKALAGWPMLVLRSKAGVGKTYSPMVDAKLTGRDVFIQECSGDMGRYDMVGSNIIGNGGGFVFQAGVVTSAIRWASLGHKTRLIMDEVNLLSPATVKGIGSAFDFRHAIDTPVGRFEADNGMLDIVCTCNSEKESAGFDLDDSFQSRALVITLSAGEIAERFGKIGKLDKETVAMIKGTDGAFSLREAQQVQALIPVYGEAKAMQMVVRKYVNEEKQKLVRNQVLAVWGPEVGGQLI
jgi:MoxR-like ATPase